MEPSEHPHNSEAFKPALDVNELQVSSPEHIPESSPLSDDELDDMVFADPRIVANMELIHEARKEGKGGRAQDLVIEQKLLAAQVRDDILKSRGEYIEPEEQLARLEEKRLKAVAEISASLSGNETEIQILETFKIMDASGQLTKESIQSPLFHTFTKNAFTHYLSMVDKFNVMSEAESANGIGLKGIGAANVNRTEAHDAVAKLVGDDLNLEFVVARRLVAKMRDEIYPGSGETYSYGTAIRRGEKLGTKFAGDVDGATRDDLRYIRTALQDAESYHSTH
jgi:hypothetical protein